MSSTSFSSFIDESSALGEFDMIKNTPVCIWDPKSLVESVGIIWEALRSQRLSMVAMEKDNQRRRTEMEIRINAMETDISGLVANEARKRIEEDNSLRNEIEELRGLLTDNINMIRTDTDEKLNDTNQNFENVTNALKATIEEARLEISELNNEIDLLKRASGSNRSGDDLLPKLNELRNSMDDKHAAICGFIGTTPDEVVTARSKGEEKECFLATPALIEHSQRIKNIDVISQSNSRDITSLANDLAKTASNTAKNTDIINQTKEKLQNAEDRLLEGYTSGDNKLSRRIDDLECSRVASSSSSDSPSVPNIAPAILSLRKEYDDIAKRLKEMERSINELSESKADTNDVQELINNMKSLKNITDDHEQSIIELKQRPAQESIRTVEYREKERPIEPDSRFDELMNRLTDAEKMWNGLQHTKADRDELTAMIKDLMKKIQKALNDIFRRLHSLELSEGGPATAGRFRCLSCNRKAGPLQEQLQERMSSSQFPPSNIYVQPLRSDSNYSNSSVRVPGMRDYGGGMTTSRKKLMNYYTWLNDKAEGRMPSPSGRHARHVQGDFIGSDSSPMNYASYTQKEPYANASRDSQSTPQLSHQWDGRDTEEGNAREAYDTKHYDTHGSVEPEAIGCDGKYYTGVKSRSNSANACD